MREIERRITKLEAGRVLFDPFQLLEVESVDAFERAELRRSFARIMLDYGERRPAGEIDLAGFRAEAAEQDARLWELLGGPEDTPELAAVDDEVVRRWETSVPKEQRDAAMRRRWPDRRSFAELAAEHEALRVAQASAAPAAEGSAA